MNLGMIGLHNENNYEIAENVTKKYGGGIK